MGAFDKSDESEHIAELLEIAGAHKISPAASLQVAAMRRGGSGKLKQILANIYEQEHEEAGRKRQAHATTMATIAAAAKFKAKLQQVFSNPRSQGRCSLTCYKEVAAYD